MLFSDYLISFYFLSFLNILFLSILLFFFTMKFLFFNLTFFFEWEIEFFNSCSIIMVFLLDWMSLMFMSFVLLISSMVIYYSKEYMLSNIRFILLILLFVFSMIMMIVSPNLISILLGWDGLGLISYCLVIYFQNVKSYNSGMLTALSNRIGDVMILMSISWMLNFGSWSYFFYFSFLKYDYEMKIISILIVIAAMTKSAQIPFSSWLPAAMAAPTPVSALVHSSTLVTAGVYLLIRFNNLINYYFISKILLILSTLTMFMSGLVANFEIDLKKIIALSTLSQLGLMMMILSLGFYKLTFFHLLTHALFKALLFLCAGSYIHNLIDFQDIRLMGNFFNQMPLTSVCFNISKLALCGMPFLAGFYSKDLILEMLIVNKMNLLIFFLSFIATMLTVSYSFRMIFLIIISSINNFSILTLSDESWVMLKSMLLLTIFSIFSGSMLNWLIFPYFSFIFLPLFLKLLILIICLIGMKLGYFLFSKFNYFFFLFFYMKNLFYMFFSLMWFMPILSTVKLNLKILLMSKSYLKNFDLGWSELIGGYYFSKNLMILVKNLNLLNNNQLKNIFFSYIFFFIIFFMFI